VNSRDTGEQRRLKVEGKKWGDSRSASAEASSRVLVLTVEVGAGEREGVMAQWYIHRLEEQKDMGSIPASPIRLTQPSTP